MTIDIAQTKVVLADPERLREAVFRTLVDYQNKGLQPGAEKWQADTRWHRRALVAAIRAEWLRLIKDENALFPWHEDFVIDLWVSCRKSLNEIKRQHCQLYGLPVPDKWRR